MKHKFNYLIILFLIVATLVSFGRIGGNSFINFDDNAYIIENDHIKTGLNKKSIQWAFTTTYCGYWHPLTWLSHILDWSLFGSNASGHHLMSLLFHIGSVIFLFLFFNKATKNIWKSAFVAALFALHPLRVESVAWAAERKDVLSMLFGMASIYAYAFYAEKTTLSHYFLCFVLFAFALMSKPLLVTLPFMLLLLDFWPLKRWQNNPSTTLKNRFHLTCRLIGEKAPFLLLTFIFSMITFYNQTIVGAVAPVEQLRYIERIANAIISYAAYLGKIFWPRDLAVFYPYDLYFPLWKILGSALLLIAITAFVLCFIKKKPFLFVGWFWYLGTLVPLIGFVQSGSQAMADRHTYLPFIGIAIMVSWGIPPLFKSSNVRKNILFPAAITSLIILSFLSWKQCGYWQNTFTLFSHALEVTENNYLAHNSRGITYGQYGRYREAIDDFNEAIKLKPHYYIAYNNRGLAYAKSGQNMRAIEDYSQAIHLNSDYARAYHNRAVVYLSMKEKNAGCQDAQKACALGDCAILEQARSKGDCP